MTNEMDEHGETGARAAREDSVVRHEEELRIGRETKEVGAVRVQKRVETETADEVVPREIEHADEVDRVEAAEGDSGQIETLPDGSVSIPVFEERLVVTKQKVVRERIVIRKRTVTEEERVTAELRKERVLVEEGFSPDDVRALVGRDVVDVNGDSIGSVAAVFVDDESGQPEWLGLRAGTWPRRKHVLAPFRGASTEEAGTLRLAWAKDVVDAAPSYDEEMDGVAEAVDRLAVAPARAEEAYAHYGLESVLPAGAGGRRAYRAWRLPDDDNPAGGAV